MRVQGKGNVCGISALTGPGDAFAQGFADATKSARQAKEWALGANWHLNKSVKLALDYANTDFKGGSTTGDRRSERAILARLQLAFPS